MDSTDIKSILRCIMSNFKPINSTTYINCTNYFKGKSYPKLIQEEIDNLKSPTAIKENLGFKWLQ